MIHMPEGEYAFFEKCNLSNVKIYIIVKMLFLPLQIDPAAPVDDDVSRFNVWGEPNNAVNGFVSRFDRDPLPIQFSTVCH